MQANPLPKSYSVPDVVASGTCPVTRYAEMCKVLLVSDRPKHGVKFL